MTVVMTYKMVPHPDSGAPCRALDLSRVPVGHRGATRSALDEAVLRSAYDPPGPGCGVVWSSVWLCGCSSDVESRVSKTRLVPLVKPQGRE